VIAWVLLVLGGGGMLLNLVNFARGRSVALSAILTILCLAVVLYALVQLGVVS